MDETRGLRSSAESIVLLVTDGAGLLPLEGAVFGFSGSRILVRMPSTAALVPGADLVILRRAGSGQQYARGIACDVRENEVAIEVAGGWQNADRRHQERFPAWIPAVVEFERTGHPVANTAVVVDLSMGGLAAETSSWPGGERATVTLRWRDSSCRFDCHVVAVGPAWRGALIHCRFDELTPEQRAWLAKLIASLQRTFRQAQRFLFSRADDPQSVASTG